MQRAMAQYVPCEMAVLGLVEFALSFAVIQAVFQTSGAPDAARFGWPAADSIVLAGMIALSIGGIGLSIGFYQPDVCLNRRRLMSVTALMAALAFAVLLAFNGGLGVPFTPANAFGTARVFIAWLATIAAIRLLHGSELLRSRLVRRVVLLGDAGQIAACAGRMNGHRSRYFELVALELPEVSWPMLRRHRVRGVVLLSGSDAATADALLDCKLRGMPILSGARFQEQYLGRIDSDALTVDDLLTADGFSAGRFDAALKRGCDIVLALAMLLLTLPLMAAAALAIRLESPGPIIYRQQRVGQYGRVFTVLKFRSMTANAEAGGRPIWAQTADPRVTRVGRFIRTCRIDELPQLVNVLRGEMSLVGPRPERPLFVEQLAQAIPFYHQRVCVKPGLTGWAQVNYPYGASIEDAREKLAYDLYYVKHRSLWLDLIILLQTVRVVLFREGAR